jgi:hypothetical protein
MPVVALISVEEHQAAISELRAEFRDMLGAYVTENEQWLPTDKALALTKIARSTLVMVVRASAPLKEEPGRITYKKAGKTALYSRSSCVDYLRNKAGQPALRP